MATNGYLDDVVFLESDDFEEDEFDEFEELLNEFEEDDDDLALEDYDDDGEFAAERRRRRRRRRRRPVRVPRARGRGYYKRPVKGVTTNRQLQAALTRVGKDITKNRSAIDINRRNISSLSSKVSDNRRINVKQNKKIQCVAKTLDDTKQFFMLSNLLGGDQTLEVAKDVRENEVYIPAGTKIEFKQGGDTMDRLLPLLLTGGLGGSTSCGSGKGGGLMDNPLMLILLLGGLK